MAGIVCSLEAEHGDPMAAFDYLALAIRTFDDAGHTAMMRTPLASLAALFDRVVMATYAYDQIDQARTELAQRG